MRHQIDAAVEAEFECLRSQGDIAGATCQLAWLCVEKPLGIGVIELRGGAARSLNPPGLNHRDLTRLTEMVDFLGAVSRARSLPDMTVAVNLRDEARVLPKQAAECAVTGSPTLYADYLGSTGRRPDATQHPTLFSPMGNVVFHAPPAVLSVSKIPGMYADVLIPDPTVLSVMQQLDEGTRPDSVSWSAKEPILYWRGSTTGGDLTRHNWRDLPRIRLVQAALEAESADCLLHNIVQCADADEGYLSELLLREGLYRPVTDPFERNYERRYVYDIEGNSYSVRLKHLLLSSSVVMKPAPIWEEYFHRWMEPGEHYVEMNRDFSDLDASVALLEDDTVLATQIAAASSDLIRRTMNTEFVYDYVAALLQEYFELTREWQKQPRAVRPRSRTARYSGTPIRYLSPADNSGYGVAGRRLMLALADTGTHVKWRPCPPSTVTSADWHPWLATRPGNDETRDLAHLNGALPGSDVVVTHHTPEHYPDARNENPGALLVGHTVWETDRLPRTWPALLEVPDLLVVPCQWNAEVIRNAGVSTPVKVVPHVAATAAGQPSKLVPHDVFVFYSIAEWTLRKALAYTITAFCQAFTRDDRVALIVKTSHRDHTDLDAPEPYASSVAGPGTTAWAVAHLLARFPEAPSIHLITRELSDAEIAALHADADCFVSLTRAEGWCVPAFDAATAGNPVVITGHGGQLDYLDESTAYLVEHDLVPVNDPRPGTLYTSDQRWAEPSVEHAASLLQQVANDPASARARARIASQRIRRDYAPPIVAKRFLEAIGESKLVSELPVPGHRPGAMGKKG